MKDLEDDVIQPSVEKSTPTVDSTVGKMEGLWAMRNEGHMTVQAEIIVDADAVKADDGKGTNLDGKAGSDGLVDERMKIKTITDDLVLKKVSFSGEDVKGSVEVSTDLGQGNVVTANASGCNDDVQKSGISVKDSEFHFDPFHGEPQVDGGDVGLDCKEPVEKEVTEGDCVMDKNALKGAEILDSSKLTESSITTAKPSSRNNGTQDSVLAVESHSRDPQCVGEESLIDREEESERGLSKEVMKQPMECDQEVADGDYVAEEKTAKEYEASDSSITSKPLTTTNPASNDVDEGLASKNEAQASVTERGLATNEVTVELSTEYLPDDAYGDGLTDKKVGEGYESLDSLKNPESLTTVNNDPEHVLPRKDEPKSSIDQTIPSTTNKVIEIDNEVQLPIADGMSGSMEDQSLKAEVMSVKPSNVQFLFNSGNEVSSNNEMNGFQVPADAFEEVNVVTRADVDKHGVVPEGMELSYEDADMERGEDAGMDIDEVLGWKDEMPGVDSLSGTAGCTEKDQQVKINENSEADVCEQVLVEHREENFKSREPIVYERRAHVEVPLYDALNESRSPLLEDESLDVETDSEEDYELVQEEELRVTEQSTGIDEVTKHLKNGSSVSLHQSCYFQPPEHEGQFSVSDLVWGKVRSHPWWPGQIVDPSDASEKAMRYHKTDCFLVAYFGDGTFAWNDSAVLKPFRANFSQIHNHANLESFKNAVSCALEEVSRRVELGLACSCVPQDVYEKIKYQVIENGGVRRKSMKRQCTDKSANVSSFEPDKLVDYVRLLARLPDEGDNMELAMAKAQLSSYGRYKGYRQLPKFQFCGNMLEDDPIPCEGAEEVAIPYEEVKPVNNAGNNASQKFKNNSMDSSNPYKERSLSDLTDDAPYSGDGDGAEGGHITSKLISSSGSRKRKARGSISDSSVKIPNLHPEKVSAAVVSASKPSFKIGERIRRVASQLSGPTKVELGQHGDQLVGSDVSLEIPKDSQMGMIVESKQESVAEMLSHLHLTAQDPMKQYGFLSTIIPFFYDRRAAVYTKSLKKHSSISKPVPVRKRKTSNENDPEEFEFDDVNDSYWTDRIIQNHSEEQFFQDNENGGMEYQDVGFDPDKPAKSRRRSNKKQKLLSNSNHETEVNEESELDMLRRQNLATEVILKFTEGVYFPSEINLNKMFRRFGPLMESETEVDRQSGRARVVFKKCCDAEVAQSSAAQFNIFGSINVNYELNYTPLVSYKPLPLPTSQDPVDGS